MEQESYRKPYIKPVRANWWMARKTYILYMLREATALCNLWAGVELAAIVFAVALCEDSDQWVMNLLQHPIVIGLNIITLIAACYHIFTWYDIFPKGVRVFTSKDPANTKMIPASLLKASLYAVTLVASIIIICALTFV